MYLPETVLADRREQAADGRGVPSSFTRAVKALEGGCTHCSAPAIVADGNGVGLCAAHRRERATMREDGLRALQRARRQIDMARAGR